MRRSRVLLSWSSGKDSAWALAILRQRDEVEVVGLLTTFDQDARRVSMHEVREELVDAQARAVGLPVFKIMLPASCSDAEYGAAMAKAMAEAKDDGVSAVAFGDLFLEDVRAYREKKLAQVEMDALFPIWGTDTTALARQIVQAGVRAYVTSVDTQQLGAEFVGREFDNEFLTDLLDGVDPCGERGEFHTFVSDGPGFSEAVPVVRGGTVHRGQFAHADLRLGTPQLSRKHHG